MPRPRGGRPAPPRHRPRRRRNSPMTPPHILDSAPFNPMRWIRLRLEFSGEIWFWRGPAPWYFVTVPEEGSRELGATAKLVTYGWGMIPVTAGIGDTEWKTSL